VSIIKPIISIIVPVYNSEKYLPRCIESILAQTFSNFELLLVNDGSSDKSGQICEEYGLNDSRIRVFHLKNGGVSKARNKGIEMAQGDYLMFSDSDDYVEKHWCISLFDAVNKNGNILPVSGMRVINHIHNKKSEVIKSFSSKLCMDKVNYFETYKQGLSGSLCCKIYIRKIIQKHSIYFDEEVNRGEDLLFNLAYINYMNAFVTIPSVTYNYVHSNENSLMNRYRKELFDVTVMVYNAWTNYLNKVNSDKDKFRDFSTFYYLNFINLFKNTFEKENKDSLIKKLGYNNFILNSKEFKECLEWADTSKEDLRYRKLLKTKNYYLIWLIEQVIEVKKHAARFLTLRKTV
jgi:glycosyltransferase involved in cell wall biosynthesis